MTTTFSNKQEILADLWLNFRTDEEFVDFIEYNDLGLPLSYMLVSGIVKKIDNNGEVLINETFNLLLAGLGIEDTGFETLDEILGLEEEG